MRYLLLCYNLKQKLVVSYQLRVTYYYLVIKEKKKKTLKGMKGITVNKRSELRRNETTKLVKNHRAFSAKLYLLSPSREHFHIGNTM